MNADLNLAALTTEARNPRTTNIDQLPTLEMLTRHQRRGPDRPTAVADELPHIAHAIDEIAARFEKGGRLFYIGAGTSGRLGVLDACECPPTFSVPPTLVQGLIAGGDSALRKSSEKSEDSREQGAADLARRRLRREQRARHPRRHRRQRPHPLRPRSHRARQEPRRPHHLSHLRPRLRRWPHLADIAIAPVTGPEVITGSTRLKAGTATKLVLNMLSTGVMIRTGAVYGNLMVNVQPTNDKARRPRPAHHRRSHRSRPPTAAKLLEEAGSVKIAIAMQKLSLDRAAAEAKLATAGGSLVTCACLERLLRPDNRVTLAIQ